MINGINHINFSVKDLDASFKFYTEVLGFKLLARWKEGAYLLAGDLWFCLNLDPNTRNEPLLEYTHIALNISQKDFDSMSSRILSAGTRIWKENTSPGDSLYFLDPDGHKLELHVSDWQSRIEIAKKEGWEGMEFFV